MAGIIKKVEQTLGMGGPKNGDKQSGVHKQGYGERITKVEQTLGMGGAKQSGMHKQGYGGQQKEGGGFLDKVKGKIPGMGGQGAKGGGKKKNIDHFG